MKVTLTGNKRVKMKLKLELLVSKKILKTLWKSACNFLRSC